MISGDPGTTGPAGPTGPSRAEVVAELTAPGAPFALAEVEVRGVPLRVFTGTPQTLRDVHDRTAAHGDATATVYGPDGAERVTWAEHRRVVAGLAAVMRTRWDLRPGDRVAVSMRNVPEWLPICWAAWVSGLVVVPLNAWWGAGELGYALGHARPRLVVADAERVPLVADAPGAPPVVAVRGPAPAGGVSWSELVADLPDAGPTDAALPDVAVAPDDDAFILYTSGTTGRPKGAVGTHRNLCTDVHQRCLGAAVGARATGTPPPERPGVLLAFPVFHVAGLCAMVTATWTGTTIATLHRWDADEARATIRRERLTTASGVPTVMRDLAVAAVEHPDDLASLTGIGMGGAPIPPGLVRRIAAAPVPIAPTNGYGLTETTSAIASNAGADYLAAPDAVGRPMPTADVRVVHPTSGADLPDGEVGELWFRGPNIVRGYWDDPAATAAAFADGWFRTGDLGWVQDGVIRVVDRIKDVVIRGGENVYGAEVEGVLLEHPAVLDAAVLGVPHPTLGEEVGAVLVVAPGTVLDVAEVHAHVAAHLAAFKAPTHVVLRTEPLPRNAVGKVLKEVLRS